jgi:dihydropteroate synthase
MSSSVPAANGTGRGELRLRGRSLRWGARTHVMGIVNVAPDSFSGDGRTDPDDAAAFGARLAQVADIVDVGAESTRPGHTPIDVGEELRRLIPVVRGIRERAPGAVISIDTYKPEVFAAAHAAGGDLLNSVWGLDDALLAEAAARGVPVVMMHNKRVAVYERDVVDEVLAALERDAARALRAGIPAEHVILDPGIGFGKTAEHNLAILGALARIVALGFPTLVGTSRKSTIGKLTGRDVGARVFGTAATVALAVAAKVDVVRVHDAREMADVVHVADAVVRGWRPEGWSERL